MEENTQLVYITYQSQVVSRPVYRDGNTVLMSDGTFMPEMVRLIKFNIYLASEFNLAYSHANFYGSLVITDRMPMKIRVAKFCELFAPDISQENLGFINFDQVLPREGKDMVVNRIKRTVAVLEHDTYSLTDVGMARRILPITAIDYMAKYSAHDIFQKFYHAQTRWHKELKERCGSLVTPRQMEVPLNRGLWELTPPANRWFYEAGFGGIFYPDMQAVKIAGELVDVETR